MRKILSFVVCMIMVMSAFTLTGCKDKRAVGKEWEVKEYVTIGYVTTQMVGFTVNRNGGKIKDVWINIREIKGENVKFNFCKYKSLKNEEFDTDLYKDGYVLEGGDIVVTAAQVKAANKQSKGWIKLNTNSWDFNYDSVLMTVPNNVVLREIVFIGTNDKILSTKINKAYVVVENKTGKGKETQTLLREFTSAELLAYAETAKYGIPNFLLDSQQAFLTKDVK
jgi:hypothetical protein